MNAEFYNFLSPETLARIVVDVRNLDKGAPGWLLKIECDALAALIANVGGDDGRKMIADLE